LVHFPPPPVSLSLLPFTFLPRISLPITDFLVPPIWGNASSRNLPEYTRARLRTLGLVSFLFFSPFIGRLFTSVAFHLVHGAVTTSRLFSAMNTSRPGFSIAVVLTFCGFLRGRFTLDQLALVVLILARTLLSRRAVFALHRLFCFLFLQSSNRFRFLVAYSLFPDLTPAPLSFEL